MACITSKISLGPSYLVDPFAMLDLALVSSSESQGGRSFLTQAMLASAGIWRPPQQSRDLFTHAQQALGTLLAGNGHALFCFTSGEIFCELFYIFELLGTKFGGHFLVSFH
jgi:hypothetical protein